MAGKQFVIIGNGIAGNSAASAIRQYDRQAEVTLISEESEPLYSPCAFHKYLSGEMALEALYLKRMEDYSREAVRTIFGQKVFDVDGKAKEIRTGEKRFPFDKLVVATGGLPVFPPIRGADIKGVFALKTLKDAQAIATFEARSAVVIGSGPIGIEAAVGLRKKGLGVFLIEILDRILPRLFDERPALILREIMDDQGIEVSTGERVLEIIGGERVTGVATDKRQIGCDMVIMGAGVRPNVELARRMGCEIGSLGGIKTNEYLKTSLEDIYACGDCVESKDILTGERTLSLLWPSAKRQGWIAGSNCVGAQKKFIGSFGATNLELLGGFAVSAGRIGESFQDTVAYETVEGAHGPAYYKLIIFEDQLVGIQLINRSQHAGLLFSRMLRRDHLLHLAKVSTNDRWLSKTPWNYWIRQYFPNDLPDLKRN